MPNQVRSAVQGSTALGEDLTRLDESGDPAKEPESVFDTAPQAASLALKMWGFAAVRLFGALALGLVLGLIFDRVLTGLFVTLALYTGWQLVNLFRLDYWVRHRNFVQPPVLGGVWDDVVTQFVRLHRRKTYHKARLRQVLRELRGSTAAMPDGVVVLNSESEIAWFNRTAAQLIGLHRKQDVGIRIDNLIRHPDFIEHLRGERRKAPVVLQMQRAPQTYLALHVLPYGNGQRLLLVRDVTRQRHLEALRKEFVANASHELRSPLTVISGYLETLGSLPTLDEELRGPIHEMRRQAERMTAIISDLLELSRLESSDEEVQGEPIDVEALMSILRKDVLARPSRPAEVLLEVKSHDQLVGDEPEIHSAFSNLVDNAAKYTPADGKLELRWWVDEEGGHFAVHDTGIGIPAEHIHRLTERFYRVDPGRSRATGGSGLGLAIVKHVLQRHGATLDIESREGEGSTFACHFPLRRIASPREAGQRATLAS
jgi:two-component system, OmpR family, phosphate regulon sensor histidine kinase PhoR